MAGDIFDFFENVGDVAGVVGKNVLGLGKTVVEGTGDLIDDLTGKTDREAVKKQQANVREAEEDIRATQEVKQKAANLEDLRLSRRRNRVTQSVIKQKAVSAGLGGSSSAIGAEASATTQFLNSIAAQSGENVFAQVLGEQAQDLAVEQDFLGVKQAKQQQKSQFKRDIFSVGTSFLNQRLS